MSIQLGNINFYDIFDDDDTEENSSHVINFHIKKIN